MMDTPVTRVLFVGESVFKIHTHYKGFASYETAYISDNLDFFTNAVRKEGIGVRASSAIGSSIHVSGVS
jgi:uncharacterized membrane protein